MTILKIDSSINGENSASRALTQSIVRQIQGSSGSVAVVERDLSSDPIPHLTFDAFADTSILDEFLGADVVVIGAPMYNFTVPSQLKAWIDRVLVSGKTFRYTEEGPQGLVGNKRVIIALARGSFYAEGTPSAAMEHLETYLRGIFNFIGIEPEFVTADGLGISPQQREESMQKAFGETQRLAA